MMILSLLMLAASGLRAAAAPMAGIVENGGLDQRDGDKPVGWYLKGEGIRAEKGVGMNASGGVLWESAAPSPMQCGVGQVIELRPNTAYNYEAYVRTENFKGKAQMCLECADASGKGVSGSYAHEFTKSDSDWVRLNGSTSGFPTNAARFTVYLYVHAGSSGRVVFDKVNVEPLDRAPVAFVVSSRYRDMAEAGPVSFHASLFPPAGARDVSARFSWTDARGARRTRTMRPADDASATLVLDVSGLTAGRSSVECALLDGARVLGTAACFFERVRALPERRVWIDRHKRCIVDGKPFFPLGMYAGKFDAPKLEVYRKGPFNCVMPYTRPSISEMDAMHAAGLKSFVILKDELLGSYWARKYNVSTQGQVDEYLKRQIKAYRNHPALLGWYVNDEAPLSEVAVRRHHYGVFRSQDDQHPTWLVMDRAFDLREYAPTADVMGGDPYPIPRRTMRCVTDFQRVAQKRLFGAYAMWNVPQAFNMASYAKDMPGCRFPTVDELRSVNWQHVAGGANGLIAYAFSLRDDFMPHWGDVCAAADEVRRMAPVLLSIEPAPQVESTSELVPCRAWVKDGDLYLLACNVVREPVEASVRIGSGNWRMAGAEAGVAAKMADGRTVAFDLPAIGVSFVRMVPEN